MHRRIELSSGVNKHQTTSSWGVYMKISGTLMGAAVFASGALFLSPVYAGNGEITLIHTGDIHGHLLPRANLRSDAVGYSMEGGVARMYTVIQDMRKDATVCKKVKDKKVCTDQSLLINTGDTLQGSGEALFSRGQAMIDVLNNFKFAAHAPGNWDFLYGPARFEETFKGSSTVKPLANWNALAANLYYTNQFDDNAICGVTAADPNGQVRPRMRILPAYSIKQVGNVKVGILGMTTARAIAAVGTSVTKNYMFADGKTEVPCYVDHLRNVEGVDVVVMISELEMARDIQIAETLTPAPDVILNSDMHERTVEPIVATNPDGHQTLIVEEGQDGTVVGQMKLEVKNGVISEWKYRQKVVTDGIKADKTISAAVNKARRPFVRGTFVPGQTVTVGGNTTMLMRPVDEVIARTEVGLHRSNFVDEDMPGVVEGTSHDLIADAMAVIGQAQGSSIRGFRYGTHVPPGAGITMEDIYHYIPIAAKLGRTDKACGADLKFAVENSIHNTFHFDPGQWAGGWMFGYSGLSYEVDACSGLVDRAGEIPVVNTLSPMTIANRATYGNWKTAHGTNIMVAGQPIDEYQVYDGRATINGVDNPNFQRCVDTSNNYSDGYTVSGYWFADDPTTINNCNPCRGRVIQVVKTDGSIVQVAGPGAPATLPSSLEVMDLTEAVVKYLQENLNGLVTADNLPIHRLTVKRLPTINPYNFNVIQPLKGASADTCPAL
jgi:2',3'-cyclic-nucleotide 2'-phosphodiesterase (5'-nucleotidase family)